MKNKLTLALLSRWVGVSLLVGSLVAWAASPEYPSHIVSQVAAAQTSNAAPATHDSAADVQDIKERVKELEAKERQNYALVLDDQRKKIDWWFSFLAVLTAVMAIAGGLIPFLMGRKDKELIEQDRQTVEKTKAEIEKLLVDAQIHTDKIHQHEADAAATTKALQIYQSKPVAAENKEITATVNTVIDDKIADPILRLRVEAIAASEANETNKAYALWNALTQLNPNDDSAQFNAGYWAGLLSDNKQESEKLPWLRLAQQHSAQALRLNPKSCGAANNYGNALADEAVLLAKNDLLHARKLWQQAGEQFAQALSIKPNMYEAARNWGATLGMEATFLTASDLPIATQLFEQSITKFELALKLKPNDENTIKGLQLSRSKLAELKNL